MLSMHVFTSENLENWPAVNDIIWREKAYFDGFYCHFPMLVYNENKKKNLNLIKVKFREIKRNPVSMSFIMSLKCT